MSRNGSGTYSAPASSWNPPVSGTAISDTDWIALLADLTTALSGSIANDGQTTCSARIPFAAGVSLSDGTVGTPAANFTSDTDNGLYRIGANDWGASAGGALVQEFTASGVKTNLADGSLSTPALNFASDTDTGLYRIGANRLRGVAGGTAAWEATSNGTFFGANVIAGAQSTAGQISDSGTLDLTTQGGGGGWPGILIVSNSNSSNANIRTQTIYTVIARGSSATFASLATGDGSGGAATFTVTCPSTGVIRITNTSGGTANVEMAFFSLVSS